MNNQRHILVGAVSLVKGKVRNDGMAMVAVCDALEPVVADWLANAPFKTVSLIIRYGSEGTDEVDIGPIDSSHCELPVSVQVALSDVQALGMDPEGMESFLHQHTLRALAAVGQRYSLGDLM